MNLYSQNAATYLSATDCRRKIAGDVCTIIRIHEFLDVFGVINFNPAIKSIARNPKTLAFGNLMDITTNDIYEFHDIAFRSLNGAIPRASKYAPVSGGGEGKGAYKWCKDTDELLLTAVKTSFSNLASISTTGAVKDTISDQVSKIDWEAISRLMDVADITGDMCRARFCEFSFTDFSALTSISASKEIVKRENNQIIKVSDIVRYLYNVFYSSLCVYNVIYIFILILLW